MKLVNKHTNKHGTGHVTLRAEDDEDMWHLYNVIQEGDSVRAPAIRRVKKISSTGSVDSSRVRLNLTIKVTKSTSSGAADDSAGDASETNTATLHITGYVQSLPRGEIFSFKARETNSNLWAYKFNDPIVAIFDPRPQMSAILPQLKLVTSVDQLPHLDSVYIGLVKETDSLFAMSPERFPLVAFSDGGQRRIVPIDSGELPPELDKITEARKQRERE
ncbi:eRF1 domain 1-domain-containing protein [Mycena amicta]|nr:eRF1 domain 1-domain-containing protein [Mycena amicta]